MDYDETEIFKKYVPLIQMRARIDAIAYNQPIVYVKDGWIIEEYPDGSIQKLKKSEPKWI